jgi:hypothetical protein
MLEWWSSLSTTDPFIVCRGQGVLVGSNEEVERQGASADRLLHRLSIQRRRMASGWRLHAGRSVALLGKAVRRLVWPLQVYDSGSMDPRELNLHLWIKLTWNQAWRCNLDMTPWQSRGSVTWQGDRAVERRQVASVDPTKWAHGLLPHPLASYAPYLSIFVKNSYIQIIFPSTSRTRWIINIK